MATRKVTETDETSGVEIEDVNETEQPEDLRLSQLMGELGADSTATITVYQSQAPGQRPHDGLVYMFKTTPDAFSLDELRDEYGGGKFRLFITRNGKMYKNIAVNIAPPKKQKSEFGELQAQPQNNDNMWQMMFEKQEQQSQQMMNMLLTVMQGMSGNNQPQQQMTLKDMVEAMTMLHGMAPQQQNNGHQDSMKALMQGIELAKELGGGGDSQDNALSLIKETLKTFGEPLAKTVMEAQNRAPQIPHSASPQITQQTHKTAQPDAFAQMKTQTEKTGSGEMNPIQLAIKPMIKFLKAKAAQDKDPSLYAEVVLDEVPDMYFVKFTEYVKNEGLVDELAKMDPEINQYRDWFIKLREELIALISDLESEPETPEVDTSNREPENGSNKSDVDPDSVNASGAKADNG